jgi:hypothetical protein
MPIQGLVDSEKTVFQLLRTKTKEIPPEQTDETSLRHTEQPSWLADKIDMNVHVCTSASVCMCAHTAPTEFSPPS